MKRISHNKLLIIAFLGLWFPFTRTPYQHQPAGILPSDRSLKATLCGKLTFIEDIKSGAKLIGLIPCGEFKPYIFDSRPGELHDYYRFQDVVIIKDKNMSISTSNYGVLYTYITKFKNYVPIDSCSECRDFSPTATLDYTKPVIDCSAWILNESLAHFSGVINITEVERIEAGIEDIEFLLRTEEECNSIGECLEKRVALHLGNELGENLHKGIVASEQVALFIKALLVKPERLQTCPSITRMAWFLTIGFNQKGCSIDMLEASSPAVPFVTDAQDRSTGVQEDGRVIEEIPGTGVAVSSTSITVLFPSGTPATIHVRGTGFGSIVVSAIHTQGTTIQNASFTGLLFTKSTRGFLDFISLQPLLKIDMLGNGSVEARNPDFYEEYPIFETWQNPPTLEATEKNLTPSITPTQEAVQTTTAAPSPTKENTSIETGTPIAKPALPSICPGSLGIAILPFLALCQHKFTLSRKSNR